ncbi:DNA modification system-associated small protein [Mesorhizobium sp. M0053]|uniref:DNA modification system-associated small protein n=1 Tax=Mesorhizobium sp. M0053 TaxID=2956864 RepID=UPI003338E345
MQNKELRAKIVDEICRERQTDPAIVLELLALESEHRDLFSWGARPNLRRDIEKIVEKELALRREASST